MRECMENVWYGWNGGECPVHPLTEVEAVFQAPDNSTFGAATQKLAAHIVWDAEAFKIIAFRVVKEYREPREFWVFPGARDVLTAKPAVGGEHYIHVREVVEGGDE